MEYEKIDNSLKVIKTETIVTEKVYDISFLRNQRLQIIKQANDYIDERQRELDEVDLLISECEKKGIVEDEINTLMPEKLN